MLKLLLQRIISLRANLPFYATLLVSGAAMFAGYKLESGKEELMAGALVGAAVASLTTFLTNFLSAPALNDVPAPFQNAAVEEFSEKKYYRTSCRVEINLCDDDTIRFHLSSVIRSLTVGDDMRQINVQPQDKSIDGTLFQSYKIDGNLIDDAGWKLKDFSAEELVVVYKLKQNFKFVSEDHAWNSPVDGYQLKISAPAGYVVKATTLSQRSLPIVEGSLQNERSYLIEQALFSNQGFRWSITKA